MNNFYKTVFLMIFSAAAGNIFSQTYATPELKQKAEKELIDKLEWVKKNPEEYLKKGGDPDAYIKENTKVLEKPVEVIHYKSPVNIKDKSLFRISDITAVDINQKHTEQEMTAYNTEAKEEYNRFNIVIDFEKNIWYYIPRNTEKQPYSKTFSIENNVLQFSNCKECDDNTFTIVEQTTNSFVVQLKPQDEGQYFVYQFTFNK
jgi:hypothetical protein